MRSLLTDTAGENPGSRCTAVGPTLRANFLVAGFSLASHLHMSVTSVQKRGLWICIAKRECWNDHDRDGIDHEVRGIDAHRCGVAYCHFRDKTLPLRTAHDAAPSVERWS